MAYFCLIAVFCISNLLSNHFTFCDDKNEATSTTVSNAENFTESSEINNRTKPEVTTCNLIEIDQNKTRDNQVQVTDVQKGIINFTLQLEKMISKNNLNGKNILFAPVSIISVLATVLLGAESNLKKEIFNLLGFSEKGDLTTNDSLIHDTLQNLFKNFSSESQLNPAVKLELSQGIFHQKDFQIRKEFVQSAQEIYQNEFLEVDFTVNNITAMNIINEWASNHTEGRIPKVIEQPLSEDTRLVILNTLFFNGEWAEPFLKKFYGENSTKEVKTMLNTGSAHWYYDPLLNFTALGLPYKGENMVMFIILPEPEQKLRDVLSSLDDSHIQKIIQSSKESDLTYSVPFLSLSENVNLKEILQSAGIQSMFDSNQASLNGVGNNIAVKEVMHNVNLDVTEAGSTGSASTGLVIETKIPGKRVDVNRPFSFFIIHRPSGIISFWGTISELN